MSRPGHPGHDFHFPRGRRVLSESGAKSPIISMGHFCSDTRAIRPCPALSAGPNDIDPWGRQ